MTFAKRAFWVLVAVTLAVYLAMIAWTMPAISDAASGHKPFDLRFTGYTVSEGRTFLSALGEQGRAIYLGPQAWLDSALPALLALVLILSFRSLLPRHWRSLHLALIAVVLIRTGFDYLENARVWAMLNVSQDQVSDAQIEAASFATEMKSAFHGIAFAALFVLLAIRFLQRRRGAL